MILITISSIFQGLTNDQIILLCLALGFGFYMAWSIGANDVANAMGTSVGSGALTLKWAIILAAIFEFGGAYLVGSNVSETIRRAIFDPTAVGDPNVLAMGMIASLPFAWAKVPVSTTHTLVGAVLGVGLARGIGAINLNTVRDIIASWVITIPAGAGLSIVFFYMLLAIF